MARSRRGAAFTLVELMMVVAILGVLASLAIYGVARYLKHSKTAEALRNLAALENGARMQYQVETPFLASGGSQSFAHEFCPNAPQVPSTVPLAAKYSSTGADWNTPGWACLKFAINEPQAYAYVYTTNGGQGTAAAYTGDAIGDLDGNGTQSVFEVQGIGGNGGDALRIALRIGNEDE